MLGQKKEVNAPSTPEVKDHGKQCDENKSKKTIKIADLEEEGEDEENGSSKKTFQRVPGQIRPVKVPGTHWSEKYGRDNGLFQTREENAPGTHGTGAAKMWKIP